MPFEARKTKLTVFSWNHELYNWSLNQPEHYIYQNYGGELIYRV